jgi:deoxycytidine triphosphate deaminase
MLNAKEILEEGLIVLDKSYGAPAQVGYDLSAKEIRKTGGSIGHVLTDKTIVGDLVDIELDIVNGREGWLLSPGTYDITMNEGCNITPNRTAMVRQRSSLLRNGAIIASSIFDPGFYTDNIGTVMIVTNDLFIEKNARVAQMYFHENNEGELYDGQFQNDKQRK